MQNHNFFDVTIDSHCCMPKLSNNQPQYVNSHSNHGPSIINQIPKSINKCLPSPLTNSPLKNVNLSMKFQSYPQRYKLGIQG